METGSRPWLRRSGQLALALWAASVAAGLTILWLPEGSKTPLVPAGGWHVDGGFVENWRPQAAEVSASIRENTESRFFRPWTTEANAAIGTIRSVRFASPAYIAIPFAGYPNEPGVGLWLECVGNGRRLQVSRGNAHEVWVERTMRLDPGWCRSLLQLVASSSSTLYWVAVGTPFSSSRLAWLKESVFVLLAIHFLAWLLLLVPGICLAMMITSGRQEDTLLGVTSATLGLGYLQFFLSYYTPRLAHLVVVCVAVAVLPAAWWSVRLIRRPGGSQTVVTPIAVAFLVSLFYLGLLYAGDVGAGSYDATYRFDPAIWSTDNQLPQLVAEASYQKRDLATLWGSWSVSDRPPLLSGVFLLARPIWAAFLSSGDNARLLFYFYQVTGLVACSLWVIPVWVLLGIARLRVRQRLLIVLFMATLGPILFNSIYIWPKMLAGTLTLSGCLLLARGSEPDQSSGWRTALGGGLLVGLGMMAHSGVVFGLPSAVLAALWRRRRTLVRAALLSGFTAALVILPWLAWQKVENPPGNALIKFALAGTYGFNEKNVGVFETVRRAYATLTLRDWLAMRATAAATIIGIREPSELGPMYMRKMDAIGVRRLDDFAQLGRSMRVANIGWLILLVCLLSGRRQGTTSTLSRSCAAWVLIGLVGLLLNVAVTWSVHITHTQSYLSLLLLAVGLCTSVLLVPDWMRRTLLTAHAAYFLVVWFWSPLRHVNVAVGPLVACVLSGAMLLIMALTADDAAGAIGVITGSGGRGLLNRFFRDEPRLPTQKPPDRWAHQVKTDEPRRLRESAASRVGQEARDHLDDLEARAPTRFDE